ncbi:hypothetical protein [Sinomicrobium sp. M5D2P17]
MKYTLSFIAIILLITGCTEKQPALEYEKAVLYEIFPAWIDSVYPTPYSRVLPLPPPPPPSPQGQHQLKDTTTIPGSTPIHNRKWVVAIQDSVLPLEPSDREDFEDFFSITGLVPDTTDISYRYKIDLNKLKTEKDITFIYRSESENADIISLSRIQFDTTGSYGVFWGEVYCGRLCAEGIRVSIRKVNGRWVIHDMEVLYVS